MAVIRKRRRARVPLWGHITKTDGFEDHIPPTDLPAERNRSVPCPQAQAHYYTTEEVTAMKGLEEGLGVQEEESEDELFSLLERSSWALIFPILA